MNDIGVRASRFLMWLVVLPEDGFERDDLAFGFSCTKI